MRGKAPSGSVVFLDVELLDIGWDKINKIWDYKAQEIFTRGWCVSINGNWIPKLSWIDWRLRLLNESPIDIIGIPSEDLWRLESKSSLHSQKKTRDSYVELIGISLRFCWNW